jgi:hypothetical protein
MWRARLDSAYRELVKCHDELATIPEAALTPESAIIYRAIRTVVAILIRVIDVLP